MSSVRPFFQPPVSLIPSLAFVVALAALSWCFLRLWVHNHEVAEEDHLMEWTQAGFLGLAACVHAFRSRNTARASIPWFMFLGLALLTASFLLRELDIDSWGNPALSDPLQTVLRLALILMWLGFARVLFRHLADAWKSLPRLIRTPVAISAFLGGCCYLASWPFEKDLFAISSASSKFIGQLLQFHACSFLLCSSAARVPATW